jgi:hypothetical protein
MADLSDWRGQTSIYANRFELLNPRWYLDNLLQEYHRYGPGLGSFAPGWLARVGLWSMLVALPASLVGLTVRARRGDPAARTLIVPALVFPALFALVIKLKLVNYTLVELPLFALVVAWGAIWLWRSIPWTRWVIAAVATAVSFEGAWQLGRLEQAAVTATAYPAFIAQVRQTLPPGQRILGLHSYWFGLEDQDYRSFLVPLNWADEGLPLDEGLSRVAPDVILLDARLRDYLNSPEVAADRERFYEWLRQHEGRVVGRIDDPTYGLMEVYLVSRVSRGQR